MVEGEVFKGTPGLWELITSRRPNDNDYTSKDYENYSRLMIKPTPFIVIMIQKPPTPKVVRAKNGTIYLVLFGLRRKRIKKDLRHGIIKEEMKRLLK